MRLAQYFTPPPGGGGASWNLGQASDFHHFQKMPITRKLGLLLKKLFRFWTVLNWPISCSRFNVVIRNTLYIYFFNYENCLNERLLWKDWAKYLLWQQKQTTNKGLTNPFHSKNLEGIFSVKIFFIIFILFISGWYKNIQLIFHNLLNFF